jgi:hypothetical protein
MGHIRSISTSNSGLSTGPSLTQHSSTFSFSKRCIGPGCNPKILVHKLVRGPLSTEPRAICWTPRIRKGRAVVENDAMPMAALRRAKVETRRNMVCLKTVAVVQIRDGDETLPIQSISNVDVDLAFCFLFYETPDG